MGSPCLDLDRPTTAINVMFLPLNTVISLTLRSIKKLTKKEMKDCRSVSIITGVLNCAANASPPVESSPPLPPVWPFYLSFKTFEWKTQLYDRNGAPPRGANHARQKQRAHETLHVQKLKQRTCTKNVPTKFRSNHRERLQHAGSTKSDGTASPNLA